MTDNAEENISTEQSPPRQDARLSRAHGNQERAFGAEAPSRQRSQTTDAVALLKSKSSNKLRNTSEYRRVYDGGKRYDGRLMTVFVCRNQTDDHRLGITASRKLSRKAVDRNRAKRLLREAFRHSAADLQTLKERYDWVLNAKRGLLEVKLSGPLAELKKILAIAASDENRSRKSEAQDLS